MTSRSKLNSDTADFDIAALIGDNFRLGDIAYRRPGDLRMYDRKLKEHPDEQIAGIAASLRAFGCVSPILVDQYDIVIDGEALVLAAIQSGSHVGSYRTYGARRVWHDLLAEGISCGLHRIERLMRQQGLRARPRRRGLPKDHGERSVIAGNVLDRQFTADRPNQKWVADFTYIWTAEGWLYVAAVIDLFSRRVVGWSMSDTMTAQLVTDALIMAIWRRGKPDALLHHSDQGSQYTSEQFQRLMADNGVTCSMSRSGNVWDNAAMVSFFSSLKTERIGKKVYRTRVQAKADVFDYIECFYNPTRRHSTLGYLSPIDFEMEAGVA
jgi:putative transposase